MSDCTLGFFGSQFFQEVFSKNGGNEVRNNQMEDIKIGRGGKESGYEVCQ